MKLHELLVKEAGLFSANVNQAKGVISSLPPWAKVMGLLYGGYKINDMVDDYKKNLAYVKAMQQQNNYY